MGKADQVIRGGRGLTLPSVGNSRRGVNANRAYRKPVLALMLLWVLLLTGGEALAFTLSGPITGRVYQDFDSDGTIDTSGTVQDVGVANVQVSIYDSTGALRETTTTDANGDYTFTVASLDGVQGPYRVEFTNLPSGYEPSRVASGTQNGTSVQFINADTAAARTVNFAVLEPCDYCQANPLLTTTGQRNGSGFGLNQTSVMSFQYNATGAVAGVAAISDTGSVWGVAYDRDNKLLFTSALAKRHAGFGPQGSGGIYVMDMSLATPAIVGSFTISGVSGISTGAISRSRVTGAISAGAAGDNQLSDVSTNPNRDLDAFAKVGLTSLGDIDVDENGNLWVVNINSGAQSLVKLDLSGYTPVMNGAPPSLTNYPLSSLSGLPACSGGSFRPWALAFQQGKGYLGGVCDAMTSQNAANLRAYVLQFDPAAATPGFSTVISFPLNFTRENVGGNRVGKWRPWVTGWSNVTTAATAEGTKVRQGTFYAYAQPILSDIVFTDNGSMVLGFIDRMGHQLGAVNYVPVSGSTTTIDVTAGGDIVQVCNVNGSWVLEGSAASCRHNDPALGSGTIGSLDTDGPSNVGEYYFQESYDGNHEELANGGLVILPGTNEVVATLYDPEPPNAGVTNVNIQGARWFNTTSGAMARYNQLVGGVATANFGKAHGLGDLELLCDPAPIEIGNRVWEDTDGDGIQDAGEAGIDGVDVTLTCGSDDATATTANGGQYLFSSTSNAAFLSSGKTCTVVVTNGQPELTGLEVTAQNADGATDNNATTDLRDSDASAAGQIVVTVGEPGENNHTLDFGYREAAVDIELGKVADKANARRGDTVVYTLTASNTSTTNATGVQVTDVLPAGVTLATGTPPVASQGTYNTTTGVWDIGNLGAGQDETLTITVTVD
ncbi:SdrD B-like domain-containing protein [Thiothrix nivea]|uniref:Conserved repeat domain protein n=1 Tax=Thiothrix nivea (strain ATCC 35100 / DSM 5205 / JP2) TaxID=870187 RepID=A0A656HKU0_THINJ|nr:SdrD B-like domain-containing protein [Thiothrix nivea]EIJ36146.1 conserved repeat domain protein [Thiothrix nivea DSM 5205]